MIDMEKTMKYSNLFGVVSWKCLVIMAENSKTNGITPNVEPSFTNGGVFFAPEGPPFGNGGPEYAHDGPTFAPEGPVFGNGGPEYAHDGPTFAPEGPAFGNGGPAFGNGRPKFGQVGPSFSDNFPNGPPKMGIPNAKPAEVKLTEYMKECLDKVALAEGFQNYTFKMEAGSGVGDGFVGILFKITIIENDSDKQLDLVVKAPPDNMARRIDFGAMQMFEREVYVYNVVLPEFVKFQEDYHITKSIGFFNFPKCYFAEFNTERDDSLIIMEDLRTTEHKMWDKFVPTNYEHTKLFVAALGRFHAVSFAMKQQRPEQFAKFKEMKDLMTEKITSDQMVMMMHASIDRAVGTLHDNEQQEKNKILNVKDNFATIIRELVDGDISEPYSIIGHGDCWSNNFMYKYQVSYIISVCKQYLYIQHICVGIP